MLEHIPKPEDVMGKVKDKFKKMLIVSIPNTGHYIHRLRLLFGHFPVQWVWHPGEHLRFWTMKDFKKWADELGFKVVGIRIHTGFPFLLKFIPSLFTDSMVFLLKNKENEL